MGNFFVLQFGNGFCHQSFRGNQLKNLLVNLSSPTEPLNIKNSSIYFCFQFPAPDIALRVEGLSIFASAKKAFFGFKMKKNFPYKKSFLIR